MTSYTTIICDTLKMTGLSYIKSNYTGLSNGNPIGQKSISLIE